MCIVIVTRLFAIRIQCFTKSALFWGYFQRHDSNDKTESAMLSGNEIIREYLLVKKMNCGRAYANIMQAMVYRIYTTRRVIRVSHKLQISLAEIMSAKSDNLY